MKTFNLNGETGINLSKKDVLIFWARIIIAAGLLVYLIVKFGSFRFSAVLDNLNYYIFTIAAMLSVFNIYLQFLKWKLLSNVCLKETDNREIFNSLFYGFAAGSFTPGRLGEYFGRGLAFKKNPLSTVAITVMIDKLFNLFFIFLFGSLSMIFFIDFSLHVEAFVTLSLILILFLVFILIGVLLVNENLWSTLIYKALSRIKFIRSLKEQLNILKNLERKSLLKLSILSFMFYLCFIVQYGLLVSSFTGSMNFVFHLWAGSLTIFVKTIIPSITFGELGIREAASMYFVSEFGFTEQAGFNAAFLLFFINILIPSLIGIALLFKRGR